MLSQPGHPTLHRSVAAGLLALLLLIALPGASPAQGVHPYASRPWLSTAGEALFRELHAAGRYANHPLARWYGAPADRVVGTIEAAPAPTSAMTEFVNDALVNDRSPLTCSQCQGLGIAQAEPTVAIDGLNVLVGFNDLEARCNSTSRQNYGWSMDGGATFTDGNHYPPTDVGGSLYGDPSHAVNSNTHAFYVGGIHGSGSTTLAAFTGLGAVKGHFGPSGFVIDIDKLAVVNPDPVNHFFDKPWMTVDPVSGNVYFEWADFSDSVNIEFQRFDANLNPLGPIVRLNDDVCGGQYGVPVVGPAGELYATWLRNDCVTGQVSVAVRKSMDFGATFGPMILVAPHAANTFKGGPGFLRTFASIQPGFAVDRSNGPHRGRLYAAWDECVDYLQARSDATTAIDTEPNNTPQQAQTLVPGGKIRGTKSGLESDWYRFEATAGQTFYLESVINYDVPGGYDSTRAGVAANVYCQDSQGALTPAIQGTLTSSGLLCTLRESGTYFLELRGVTSEVAPYVGWTGLLTPGPGARARDQRDQVIAWSDDGLSWSTPMRIVDSAVGCDAQYPWPAVDSRGRVHCTWMDFRLDPQCGPQRSIQVVTSSGDGGLTWGPNRVISDVPTSWDPHVCVSNGNNQGDYQHTVADGDRLVAAFTDQRLGDPDIFVDASVYRATAASPLNAWFIVGRDTTIAFTLTNDGNFTRELGWRFEETRGWLIGADPALSGTVTLAPGHAATLTAMIHLQDCVGDSSEVSLVHFDPAIPGFEERCTTRAHCADQATPALASLVDVDVAPGLVRLKWYAPDATGQPATVSRRFGLGAWEVVGRTAVSGDGFVTFEDREDLSEGRYGYRLEIGTAGAGQTTAETWVEIRRPRFALAGVAPNPSSGFLTATVALESGAARLELYDVGGRRVMARDLGPLGPGTHALRIPEHSRLPAGVYTIRLVQGRRAATARAVVVN